MTQQASSEFSDNIDNKNNNKIVNQFKSSELSNLSVQLRSIAQKSIDKCTLTDNEKLASGQYDWVQIDPRTSVLRKIK